MSNGPAHRRGLFLPLILLALAAAFYGAFVARTAFDVEGRTCWSLFDDAMISMKYARNLASGDGLRWNPGEPAVEGYTNFLWTLLMAGVHALPIGDERTSLGVMILGGVILLVAAVTAWRLGARISGGNRLVAAAACAMTAFYYPLVFWTLRGLEVGLQCWVMLASALFALRLRDGPDAPAARALAFCSAASVLIRPDGVLSTGIVLALLAWAVPAERRREALLPAVLTTLAVLVLHTAGRWIYYGDLLPNTYYLKATGVPVADRLGRGVESLVHVARLHYPALLVALAVTAVAARGALLSFAPGLLLAMFAGQCAYSVLVGGDAWEWMDYSNRFLAPAVPGALIVGANGLAEAGGRFGRVGLLLAGAGAALLLVEPNRVPVRLWLGDNAFHVADDAKMTRLGIALREATPPDAVPAVVWAGAIPYFCDRNCVDLLGKNDPVVAKGPAAGRFIPGHNKWNYRHSIGRLEPEVVFQTAFVWREPGFFSYLARKGYERLPNEIWVHASADVDRERLRKLPTPSQ